MHAFYHKLGKTLNAPSMEAKCTEANHEDFARVVSGLWLEVRGGGIWGRGAKKLGREQ